MFNIFAEGSGNAIPIEILVPILIALATGVFTLMIKTVISIYQKGVLFRAKFITKEEYDVLEREIREDLKFYKEETTKVIMLSVNEMLKEKLAKFEDIQSIANEVHVDKETIDLKMEIFNERLREVAELKNAIITLNNRVNSIQMDSTLKVTDKRREE